MTSRPLCQIYGGKRALIAAIQEVGLRAEKAKLILLRTLIIMKFINILYEQNRTTISEYLCNLF